jgi:elongation factor P
MMLANIAIFATMISDMALAYTDLTKGVLFMMDGAPYEVLETHFLRMQQRKAVVQTRIRNLITGKLLDRNFQASDSFEEAEIERKHAIFIYESKGQYWFHEDGNPKARFSLEADVVGDQGKFLKPNTRVQTMVFKEKVIQVEIPVKMEFKVVEAPPALKGNTAQGGNKVVTIEGGAKISAPLFVNEGDMIRVNTQTGDYVERV